jgi:hypothetical protein
VIVVQCYELCEAKSASRIFNGSLWPARAFVAVHRGAFVA